MGEVGRLADGMLGIKRGRLCVERIDEGDQLAGLCVFDSGDRTGEGIRAWGQTHHRSLHTGLDLL